MAQTDPHDIEESKRSGRKWSFAGVLQGIKTAFGVGGKHIITASPNASKPPPAGAKPPEVVMAQKSIAQQGEKYWSRMEKSEAKLKMWHNDFLDELDLKLRTNFHPENWRRMTLMKHSSTNLLQRIVGDISITYEQPPRRFFKEDEAEMQEAQEAEPKSNLGELEEEEETAPPEIDEKTGLPVPERKAPPEAPVPEVLDTGIPEVDALANELSLEGAEKPEKDNILEKLAEHSNLDAVMENVEMFSRFLPCLWVRPMVEYKNEIVTKKTDEEGKESEESAEDPESGYLCYVIYTPDMADVVTDPQNPNRMLGFWYYSWELDERGDMAKFINFWTDVKYIKLDTEWRVVNIEDNPYGCIPVAEMKLGLPSNCYYVDGQGDDIYDGSLELCVLKTIQNCRARDSGFKQMAISGDEKDMPADQVLGGPTPFYTGEGGSVTILDMEPQLQQWTDMCRERSVELAAKYGISAASYKAEGEPQSGFAKKLDMGKILSINKRGRKYFKKAEIDLYRVTRSVMDARPVPDIGTLPDKTFDIDFAEPTFDEDPKAQTEVDSKRIKLGLDSIIDVLKRENPDLTEVELLRLAAKKKKINDALIPKPASTLMDVLAASGKAPAPGDGGPSGNPAPPSGFNKEE